jgi:flavin reductase (DIM6/NTAB) family NADH-FMN oxidoreductase RutF
VTTRDEDGTPLGLTVNAFCSVSLAPPLVLACIDNRSEANAGLQTSRVFGVSVLSEEQEAFSRRFAVPGREKFEAKDLHTGESGVPLVPHALAHLECRLIAFHPAGDHTVYVGEVVRLEVRPGRPLLFHASGYRRLERGGDPTD